MRFIPRGTRALPALLIIGLLLASCDSNREAPRPANELRVGVLDDPMLYQPATPDGEVRGYDHDLLQAFATSHGKSLAVVAVSHPEALLALLAKGEVDFVAAVPVAPSDAVRYSATVREAKPVIVQHADALPVDDAEALAGHQIEVLPGTAEETELKRLETTPPITIEHTRVANGIELLARVADHRAELAASDSAHFDVAVNYYPDLALAQELPGKITYAWAFRPGDEALHAQANAFISTFRQDGRMARLHDRYFGHINRISTMGASQFIKDMHDILPRFRPLFQQAQAVTGVDWRLLAALSYQESKWNPLATSYTNVRGIMMLTEDTADRLRVDNRLDARQSIAAGARYLAELIDRLPGSIPDPDRQWMALAAYNLGYGHLNGARQFAVGLKRDPDAWYDMKKVLPLMSRPEYYARLKAGLARGGEAVILVENVRTYYDILRRHEPVRHSPLQTGLAMQ
jgi:membrane-bound lytic murein transglycosylase F